MIKKKTGIILMVTALILPITISIYLVFYTNKVIPIFSVTPGLDYNTVVNNFKKTYIGKEVSWAGKISNLSQIDGIKFWIVDDQHRPNATTYNDWFWALPADLPTVETTHGKWVTYMLRRYGNIDANSINGDNDVFLIKGKLLFLDCDFYNNTPTTPAPCIPNLEVENIQKLLTEK